MKIGILTFHDGINHGGFFQAFSTYSFLKNNGYDVEIINYKNRKHWLQEYKSFLCVKNPFVLISNLRKIIAFKKDQKKMDLGRFSLNTKNIKNSYDVIIVGSDIVWNYEWSFLGNDPVYFGHGLNSKKWISYAPSFGSVSYSPKSIPSYVESGLKKFSHISVRDENSKEIVNVVSGRDSKIVLDPTFLLDTNGMENSIDISEPYFLIYAYLLSDNDINQALDFARKKNLKVVAIGYKVAMADINIINVGPFDWIGYFSKADYVLTSTFHGTLYSIKYKKNFIVSSNENILNKTETILSKLGLRSKLSTGNLDFEDVFSEGIDYDHVNSVLVSLIEESKKYLIEAIESDC
ncbi:polysaccharide pyruvyl transferase family protein [Vibrio metschnikovii]|nr:polysaccharide pyruvyl transferase family protein [Vibrio metschnikovii]